MMTDAPTEGVQRLDLEECLRLLAIDDVGRLAIVQGGAPAIFPVNYVLDGTSPVFRTDPGTKLTHGPGTTVCFEIDGLDRDRRSGWSVVVTGVMESLDDADEATRARVRTLPRLGALGILPDVDAGVLPPEPGPCNGVEP